MDCISTRLPYRQANHFTKIILDYLDHAESLKPFYLHSPSLQGIQKAIEARKSFSTNRQALVEELKKQHAATRQTKSQRILRRFFLKIVLQLLQHINPIFLPGRYISFIKFCTQLSWLNIARLPCRNTILFLFFIWVQKMPTLTKRAGVPETEKTSSGIQNKPVRWEK